MYTIRQATLEDSDTISSILIEAAQWLEQRGIAMWRMQELKPERIAESVAEGLFFVAEQDGETAGTIKFQLTDPAFWPDVQEGDAVYIHRLAVRRRFAGGSTAAALLDWATERCARLGRRFVRLDCEASRPRLRAVYERFGFRHHSDRQVGQYFVARYELDVT
jgi:GNAT superfamily N-acetyltransferase